MKRTRRRWIFEISRQRRDQQHRIGRRDGTDVAEKAIQSTLVHDRYMPS